MDMLSIVVHGRLLSAFTDNDMAWQGSICADLRDLDIDRTRVCDVL